MMSGYSLEKEFIAVYRDVLVAAIWSGKDIETATEMAEYALNAHPRVLQIVDRLATGEGA
jgi:hypothetical protein